MQNYKIENDIFDKIDITKRRNFQWKSKSSFFKFANLKMHFQKGNKLEKRFISNVFIFKKTSLPKLLFKSKLNNKNQFFLNR